MPITCPTGCADSLIAVQFDVCAPDFRTADIEAIYVANPENPLTDWTSLAEWTPRLDNTAANPNSIVRLTTTGSLPAPTRSVTEMSGDRKAYGKGEFALSFTVDEMNALNHSFVQSTQCGTKKAIWFKTSSGHLYGGNTGVECDFIMELNIQQGSANFQNFEGTASWKSKLMPDMIVSPV